MEDVDRLPVELPRPLVPRLPAEALGEGGAPVERGVGVNLRLVEGEAQLEREVLRAHARFVAGREDHGVVRARVSREEEQRGAERERGRPEAGHAWVRSRVIGAIGLTIVGSA